jgi:ATP-dependent DNA helicase RecG
MTEGRSTGTPKILKKMAGNGSPAPLFETDDDRLSFVIRLPRHPLSLVPSLADSAGTDQVTDQVTGEVERLLAALALGLGLVEMIQPDKPRSRHQRYRLTALGQRWLKIHPKNSNKS